LNWAEGSIVLLGQIKKRRLKKIFPAPAANSIKKLYENPRSVMPKNTYEEDKAWTRY
jgi:hypothetical protein